MGSALRGRNKLPVTSQDGRAWAVRPRDQVTEGSLCLCAAPRPVHQTLLLGFGTGLERPSGRDGGTDQRE